VSAHEHDAVVRQSFEKQAGLFVGEDSPFARRPASALTWLEPLDLDMVVLDVACGAAHAAEQAAPHVRQVVGVDLTTALLDGCAPRASRTCFCRKETPPRSRSSTPRSISSCAGARYTTSPTAPPPSPRWGASAGPVAASSSPTWWLRAPRCATPSTSCTDASTRHTPASCSRRSWRSSSKPRWAR